MIRVRVTRSRNEGMDGKKMEEEEKEKEPTSKGPQRSSSRLRLLLTLIILVVLVVWRSPPRFWSDSCFCHVQELHRPGLALSISISSARGGLLVSLVGSSRMPAS